MSKLDELQKRSLERQQGSYEQEAQRIEKYNASAGKRVRNTLILVGIGLAALAAIAAYFAAQKMLRDQRAAAYRAEQEARRDIPINIKYRDYQSIDNEDNTPDYIQEITHSMTFETIQDVNRDGRGQIKINRTFDSPNLILLLNINDDDMSWSINPATGQRLTCAKGRYFYKEESEITIMCLPDAIAARALSNFKLSYAPR